jgi:rSAM/selenodomain-associated transferase 1
LTGIATGDQGLFVQRALFEALGGYPDQPLMEDIALSVKLKRAAGPPLCLRERIVTSGRRWESHGTLRTIAAMWRLRYAYWGGTDPARLAARYPSMRPRVVIPEPPTLLIFAKEPVPGSVKTRLAVAIGADRAASVHARLAERTLALAVEARAAGIVGRVELWCDPDARRPAFEAWRDRHGVELAVQQGSDLGARMHHALLRALARGVPAMLIGTDCPVLDADVLAQAATALTERDVVLVPAEDGGYVLVGLAQPLDIFGGIAWSTADVMPATRSRLAAERATWRELPVLWDVDLPQDLARWEALVDSAMPRPAD